MRSPSPALLRLMAGAALVLWCVLGTVHTAVVLLRPQTGLWSIAEDPAARAIGVPLQPGSRLVVRLLALLEHTPASARVRVMLPAATDSLTGHLVRQQLAHLAYPRRVEVLPSDPEAPAPPLAEEHDHAVVADGAPLEGGWKAIARDDGLTLYRRTAR